MENDRSLPERHDAATRLAASPDFKNELIPLLAREEERLRNDVISIDPSKETHIEIALKHERLNTAKRIRSMVENHHLNLRNQLGRKA